MKNQQSVDCQGAAAAMKKKASRQLQENSYHNGTFARSEFLTIHTRIFAYSTQMHTPLNPPSDPPLLAFGIPKHFRESEMNKNNNIPPSEDLHNTHMREYAHAWLRDKKSEGLLNIHPRLSKKRVPPISYSTRKDTYTCLWRSIVHGGR